MILSAIGTPWWIVVAGILVFLLLVILRFALGLAKQVKALQRAVEVATERLQDAVADVSAERRIAEERLEHLRARRGRS